MNARKLADPRGLVFAVVATVAVFAFIVSYSHIYDLGLAHAQFGVAARLLPLSVDLLIVGASLVLFVEGRKTQRSEGLARWLPRAVLWAAIGATVAANVAYGLPHGWLAAVISGWPGAAFVAAVEVAMVTVRPAVPRTPGRTHARTPPLPTIRDIRDRRQCSQETAKKAREEVVFDRRGRGVAGATPVIRHTPAADGPPGASEPPQIAPAGTHPVPTMNGNGRR